MKKFKAKKFTKAILMIYDLSETKTKKEWIAAETEKFAERGKLSYKVRNELIAIIKEIEQVDKDLRWHKKSMSSERFEQLEKDLKYCKEEILPLAENLKQYRSFQESDLHCLISNLTVWEVNNKNKNFYYDFKKLVNMVNAYWDITGEKPAHRLAWGWEKAMEKDNPRAYLYGCIRNYLKRNGKFDKDEFNNIWFGRNI